MLTDSSVGFAWATKNVSRLLPEDWSSQLLRIADKESVFRLLTTSSITSREADSTLEVPTLTVPGTVLRDQAPWLYELYHTTFCKYASMITGTKVSCATNDLYGAVLNVQRGPMRYECHVDSNPLQGLLYVTTHKPGEGGELVVARDPAARSVDEVEADCDEIYPVAGHLHFFDARRWPHYVRELRQQADVRVVVAMNFYTTDCPESERPADLNPHLFGVSI